MWWLWSDTGSSVAPSAAVQKARPWSRSSTSMTKCATRLRWPVISRRGRSGPGRHTGNTWAADCGANLRELMERMGHSSTRAALIYLHASRSDDRRIADGIGRQLARETARARATRKAMTGLQRGHLGRDLAR